MTRPALRAHPIAELVPDMTLDQYSALRYDIREHGLRTPIVGERDTFAPPRPRQLEDTLPRRLVHAWLVAMKECQSLHCVPSLARTQS